MSIQGFNVYGETERYDFNALDNIPESFGADSNWFLAEFGTTTGSEVEDAINDGKAIAVLYNQAAYILSDILSDEETGTTFRFTRVSGNVSSEITLNDEAWTDPADTQLGFNIPYRGRGGEVLTVSGMLGFGSDDVEWAAVSDFYTVWECKLESGELLLKTGEESWSSTDQIPASEENKVYSAISAGKIPCIKLQDGNYYKTLRLTEHRYGTAYIFVCWTDDTIYSIEFLKNRTNAYWRFTYEAVLLPQAGLDMPQPLGNRYVGESTAYAREDHVHPMPTAADIGAIEAPESPEVGSFLVWDGDAWTAQTISSAQGVSF